MSSPLLDRFGAAAAVETREALDAFDAALDSLVVLAGDPVGNAEQALALEPRFALAQLFLVYLDCYATTRAASASAAGRLAALAGRDDLPPRERAHLAAATAWQHGELAEAAAFLEQALLIEPRDLLALKVAQDLYFFLGAQTSLRDSPARVLSSWTADRPGHGYVQGIFAFGLEENGQYADAERAALAALAADPKDVWAVHARAHVLEMEGRQQEGVDFLAASLEDWKDSYFAAHNWWHRALYHIELDQLDVALRLYDEGVRRRRSDAWLDLVDAAALLWRLSLYRVEVEDRAEELVSVFVPRRDEVLYAFNDWHMAMAFALAGRSDLLEDLLKANAQRGYGTNARVLGDVGLDLLGAFASFSAGEDAEAADALYRLRPRSGVVGGSNAQRDILDLTLLAAAARAGDEALVRALRSERDALKPTASAANARLVAANRR